MKKLLLILITAVVGFVAHADITVYYDNSSTGFSPMKIQYWGNDFGANNQNMTPVDGSSSIYKFDLPDNTQGCLFYNGEYNNGNQTENVEPPTHNHLYKGTKVDGGKCSVDDNGPYNGSAGSETTPYVDGYYVYFVNQDKWKSVNIFAWNENDHNLTNANGWPGEEMELVSGNTYIWHLPAGKGVPTNVKFSNGGANATDDLVFKNHATYYPDGSIVEETVRGANILYCHFKTDRVRRTNGNENAIPRCHVFGNGDVHLTEWGTDAEKMTKIDDPTDENGEGKGGITARYELWKYEIPVEEFQSGKYNNAVFYVAIDDDFSDDNKTNKWQTDMGWGDNRNTYLKENWTKYIYATCECEKDGNKVNYAVPSYVTPSEFLTLHQKKVVEKGRDGIFIVGPKNNFTYKDAASDQWLQFNDFKTTDQRRLTPDDGVFYLQVQPNENGGNMFKLSWMDVLGQKNTAETREGGASSVNEKLANDRNWATFDLGSIGIDTKLVPSEDYAENEGPAGRVTFQLNRPYKYTNNNACDWSISGQTSASRWIILDTHYDSKDENYQCETVTITDFDPHPTLTAEFTTFETAGELPTNFDRTKEPHLYACGANGEHKVNLKYNYAHAQATIGASTTNSNFTRNYEIKYDDKNVADIPGTIPSFKYDYYPVNVSGSSLKIRARYKDKQSGLRFHSLTSDGKPGNLEYHSYEPTGTAVDAKYIEEECKVTYKTDDKGNQLLDKHKKPIVEKVERTFGVLVPNFNINIESDYKWNGNTGELGAYADYRVFDENGKEITEKCKLFTGTENPHMIDCINLTYGKNAYDKYCWNWSEGTHWAQALKEETGSASLYFETINETPVADVKDLEERTYTIELQAVYPLVYQKNPSLVASASEANGESVAKTAADPTSPEYVISHVRKTDPITVTVKPDGTVTGVDDVFGDAEADNADAPAEYYTISGVRVNGDPAPGIYVVRRGNKVTKEVVK